MNILLGSSNIGDIALTRYWTLVLRQVIKAEAGLFAHLMRPQQPAVVFRAIRRAASRPPLALVPARSPGIVQNGFAAEPPSWTGQTR
jgi:hypothetical protein